MKRLSLPIALGVLLLFAQFVSAHAFIDHCTPAVGAMVTQIPPQVRCVFTDAIDPRQTVITVTDANTTLVSNLDLKGDLTDPNGMTVIETLNPAKMTNGVYTVQWSTVAQDGHMTDGQWQFSIALPVTPTLVPTAAPTSSSGVPVATPTPIPATLGAPTINAAWPASVALVIPTDGATFPNAPSDILVGIQPKNFALGQGNNRWQVYLDGKLALQVMDGSLSAMLHAVAGGDHAIKVALATGDNTIVATDGAGIGVGPGPGYGPTLALTSTCGMQSLSAGGDVWSKIPYQRGTQLEITLDENGAGIGFAVWDPDQIKTWNTPDQVLPVGSGAPNPAEPSHDLIWVGHLPDNGDYYIHLMNNAPIAAAYRLCSTLSKLP